jgi:hypothetical protein
VWGFAAVTRRYDPEGAGWLPKDLNRVRGGTVDPRPLALPLLPLAPRTRNPCPAAVAATRRWAVSGGCSPAEGPCLAWLLPSEPELPCSVPLKPPMHSHVPCT